jgi:ABC-2 type transport system permease protein
LSPLPTWLVATAGRVLATMVETLGAVVALYLAVHVVVPFHLAWLPQATFPLLFVLASSVGYSLIVGGLTLIWKRVELLNDIVSA